MKPVKNQVAAERIIMNITIDGKQMAIKESAKNIVDIAGDNGITIIAPCYRNKRKHGCCNACLIEVNGEKKYACTTKPADEMEIVYNREDLVEERAKKLDEYVKNIKSGVKNSCCGGSTENTDSCSCGSDSSCGCG